MKREGERLAIHVGTAAGACFNYLIVSAIVLEREHEVDGLLAVPGVEIVVTGVDSYVPIVVRWSNRFNSEIGGSYACQ